MGKLSNESQAVVLESRYAEFQSKISSLKINSLFNFTGSDNERVNTPGSALDKRFVKSIACQNIRNSKNLKEIEHIR